MSIISDLTVIVFTAIIIFIAGDKFASASSRIGHYFNIPNSVKGATIDAVSSSAPELMVALFSVIAFGTFEIGVGTIVGSALFNLLLIPALCVLGSGRKFKLGKAVIYRDGVFYALSVLFLLGALLYSKTWGVMVAIIFLASYGSYVFYIARNVEDYWVNHKQKPHKKHIKKEFLIAIITLLIIGVSAYFLTGHSESLSHKMGVPPLIIGFTIVAIATSLPDGVISIADAKKGGNDDAVSNMLGSNIFNIFVGLSVPLLIVAFISGPVRIGFHNIEIVIALLAVTLWILFALHRKNVISRRRALIFISIFLAFQGYFVYLAFA